MEAEDVKKVLVTGGAGFIGSHIAEFYVKKGSNVIVLDNISRAHLLGKGYKNAEYNWNHLRAYDNVKPIKGDITNFEQLKETCKDVDAIIHAAAQTAVATSLTDPRTDFMINTLGTFNVLEAARQSKSDPTTLYCSTNKVYGSNVNKVPIKESHDRYDFTDEFENGIPESLGVDLSEHTPYGTSKLAGDLYTQDYAKTYGLRTGVFRMSCIYGPRQFGVEDQGWVAWFTIATITGKPITIYGDGKQVRDVLYIDDLIKAFDLFLNKSSNLRGEVFNIGGGPKNTLSLLELINLLTELTGKKITTKFDEWRPSDQKVYVSDIRKTEEKLGWSPTIEPREGIGRLAEWVTNNPHLFAEY